MSSKRIESTRTGIPITFLRVVLRSMYPRTVSCGKFPKPASLHDCPTCKPCPEIYPYSTCIMWIYVTCLGRLSLRDTFRSQCCRNHFVGYVKQSEYSHMDHGLGTYVGQGNTIFSSSAFWANICFASRRSIVLGDRKERERVVACLASCVLVFCRLRISKNKQKTSTEESPISK